MIGRAILLRDIQKIVRQNASIGSYRVNVSSYVMALIAERTQLRLDLEAIWLAQAIGTGTQEAVTEWAPLVHDALRAYAQTQTVHIDNVLKSEATWRHLQALQLRLPAAITRELIECSGKVEAIDAPSPQKRRTNTPNGDDVALCMELSGKEWAAINEWSLKSKQLKGHLLAFPTLLHGMAEAGWKKRPSLKQAGYGAEIVRLARSAGIIGGPS